MSSFPKRCLVDTNVPMTANLAITSDSSSDIPDSCIEQSVDAVMHIVENGGLVLDDGGEIFEEYVSNLSLKGQPGVGDAFVKWVHDHQWNANFVERVKITRNSDSYNEFPNHIDLSRFDNSDRKFIAVANAHQEKPPVFQATDSKWWGWKDTLHEVGIIVSFLCPNYVKAKYMEKMGK